MPPAQQKAPLTPPASTETLNAQFPAGQRSQRLSADRYERFELPRPKFLGDEHWECIDTEIARLHNSLETEDDSRVLSDLKCLVEAVAKVAFDIAGKPVKKNKSFEQTVNGAHELLAQQPGHQLATGSVFDAMATQAKKMAFNLGRIRNEYGGGHGRARVPVLRDEMVDLALDGGLIWVRWALRRLGLFSEGRPGPLIEDLVGHNRNFYSGVLRRRLEAANLPKLEPHQQRKLGVAVGQRAMQGTIVVQEDGVDSCLQSDDLAVWPTEYRIGLLIGLWFSPSGKSTLTPDSIKKGLTVLDPVQDCSGTLVEQVRRVRDSTQPGLPKANREDWKEIVEWIRYRTTVRPAAESAALNQLLEHLAPDSSQMHHS